MTTLETLAQVRVGDSSAVERLVCHPQLPLAAALDSERPAVRIWDCGDGKLRELGVVGADSAAYGDDVGWKRFERTPSVAWHPNQPMLLVASADKMVQWRAGELSEPTAANYRYLAFSPDGEAVWASPSSRGGEHAGESSDIIGLSSGTVGIGPRWDTGIVVHPAGGLVFTLCSDQGATLGIFARVDQEQLPTAMRVQRRALVLDVDGYETPIVSADGRYLSIRGNSYGNTLDVFKVPSLERVLAITLGSPTPPYPYPQEWLDEMNSWSRHNMAFAAQPAVLWVGTPDGTLLELDLDDRQAVEHNIMGGAPVTALSVTATGQLLVACGAGELRLLSVFADSPTTQAKPQSASDFLDSTSDVPYDAGDLWSHLVLTDGTRTWDSDDLATVTTATTADSSEPEQHARPGTLIAVGIRAMVVTWRAA